MDAPNACARRWTRISPSIAASAWTRRRATCGTPTSFPTEDKTRWRVQQMLVDPDEANDWAAEFDVDLPRSRANAAKAACGCAASGR